MKWDLRLTRALALSPRGASPAPHPWHACAAGLPAPRAAARTRPPDRREVENARGVYPPEPTRRSPGGASAQTSQMTRADRGLLAYPLPRD